MMIAMVVFAPFGGRLSERLGARTTVFIGTVLSLVGLILIADFANMDAPRKMLIGLILMGTGLGLSSAPSQAAAMSAVEPAEAGMAAGTLSMARYIGGIIGISVLGFLLGSRSGVDSHAAAAVVYAASLVMAAGFALALPGRSVSRSA